MSPERVTSDRTGRPSSTTERADGEGRGDTRRAPRGLGTENHLGLAGDPQVVEAAVSALRQYGTSTSGSRVLTEEQLHRAGEIVAAAVLATRGPAPAAPVRPAAVRPVAAMA